MTVKAENAAELVANTAKRFPDAVRLARTVSLASRIEPELLREARLRLLPGVSAGAEADLWFSPLVQSATPLAITLFPAVADLLRRELAQSPESLQHAWELLKEIHQNAPAAIRLEERVTFETLAGRAGSLERVEQELMSVVSAISEQKRSGLARWALRAVPRLPEAARQTQAASTLVLTAAAHLDALHLLDQQIESKTMARGFINQLQIVLPPDLPRVLVGVQLLKNWAEPESDQPYFVEFRYPSLTDLSVISVPATVPLMLEVSWDDSSQEQFKNVNLYRGRTEAVAVGATTVNIRTAAGDVYTLREYADENVQSPINATGANIPAAPSIGYITRRYRTGRDIAESVKAELMPGRKRLVQIWGPGGSGKTVIASHIARELLEPFNQRVIWKSAEGRPDFNINTLLDGIALQLGRVDLWTLNIKEKEQQVKALLSASPTLIFIDDFEVIEEKFRSRILNFLRRSEAVAVIITQWRIDGIYQFVVGRMLPHEADNFLERIISQKESYTFAGFDLIRVHDACEVNPLAMKWLVAQVDVTDDLQTALAEVEKRKGSAVERVFQSSFNLPQLGDEGRGVLLTLLLFVPSASRPALSQVAGFEDNVERFDEVIRTLAQLELISVSGERLSITGLVRHLLPTIPAEIRQRFTRYFLGYVQQHRSPTPQDYDALEAEYENVLDAMDIAVESKAWDQVTELASILRSYFDVRGYWDECLRRNKQGERAARMMKLAPLVLQFKQASADIHLRRREFKKAQVAYEFLFGEYQRRADTEGMARVMSRLGSIALEQERLDEAQRYYSAALRTSRELRFNTEIANNLHNLAIVAQERGDLAEARRLYLESLELTGSLNDDRNIAISMHQLGVIALETGNYDEADRFLRQSLVIKGKLQDRNGMADTLHQLGLLCQAQGKVQEAVHVLREALGIYNQLGSPSAREVEDDLNALLAGKTPAIGAAPEIAPPATRKPTKRRARKSMKKSSPRPRNKSMKAGKKAAKKGAHKRRGILIGGSIEKLFRPSHTPSSKRRRPDTGRFRRASAKVYKH